MDPALRERIDRVAAWSGLGELDDEAVERLQRYAAWLVEEAIPAGGIGPREAERIWTRHVLDGLIFAAGWRDRDHPSELLDVGTGVGLPGIPLAIVMPDTLVTLLDRGGRRIRLIHRVLRVLELTNAVPAQADVFAVADEWEALTFRGSVKAQEAVGLASRLLTLGGTAVLGLSRKPEPPPMTRDLRGIAGAMGLETELDEVPPEILDGPAWLLIMRS